MKNLFMIGDSLIEYGNWDNLLPEYNVINRGQAGETAEGLFRRLEAELDGLIQVDFALIMTGTNNVAMDDFSFPTTINNIIHTLGNILPKNHITLNCLFPIEQFWITKETINNVNKDLFTVTRETGANFLDLVPSFQQCCNRQNNSCFSEDGVHLSIKGYNFWAEEIRQHLKITDL